MSLRNLFKDRVMVLAVAGLIVAAGVSIAYAAGGCCGEKSSLSCPVLAMAENAGAEKTKGDAYPLDTCIVSGETLGSMGAPFVLNHEGREVRFCCRGCVSKFDANSEDYLKKMDTEIVRAQKPLYPLDKCVVSGETLGEMGDPVDVVYNNRLVRLCCKGCVSKLNSDPGKYLEKLDAAVGEDQVDDYPLETCLISGEKLGGSMGKPVDFVQGNRLFRLCCSNCVKAIQKDPVKANQTLDAAYVAAQVDAYAQTKCPVSGQELGTMGESVDYLYGNQLVRFCCKECIKRFEANPEKYLVPITATSTQHDDSDNHMGETHSGGHETHERHDDK